MVQRTVISNEDGTTTTVTTNSDGEHMVTGSDGKISQGIPAGDTHETIVKNFGGDKHNTVKK